MKFVMIFYKTNMINVEHFAFKKGKLNAKRITFKLLLDQNNNCLSGMATVLMNKIFHVFSTIFYDASLQPFSSYH